MLFLVFLFNGLIYGKKNSENTYCAFQHFFVGQKYSKYSVRNYSREITVRPGFTSNQETTVRTCLVIFHGTGGVLEVVLNSQHRV